MRRLLIAVLIALAAMALATPPVAARPANFCDRHPRQCVSPTPAATHASPWTLAIDESFDEPVALGSFPAAVSDRWFSYPYPWSTLDGYYAPEKVVSIHDGYMDLWLHAESGRWLMAASVPKFADGATNQLYGRYELRWSADSIAGYYAVPLLWPQSEDYLGDGEVDWPEGNLTGTISGFVHHVDASSGGDQKACPTDVAFSSGSHTTVIEWTPSEVDLFLDGGLICSETSRVPSTPMHWVLQFTTSPQGLPPAGTSGHVRIYSARVWSYTP